jgi:hypothetical protein
MLKLSNLNSTASGSQAGKTFAAADLQSNKGTERPIYSFLKKRLHFLFKPSIFISFATKTGHNPTL